MDKYLVVVFNDESQAYGGSWSLQDLNREGRINLYAVEVIVSNVNGKVEVKQPCKMGPIGAGTRLLSWSLIRLLNGQNLLEQNPEAFGGALYDLAKSGVGEDFLCEVGCSMKPGRAAVVAEVWEEGELLVDTNMERLKGVVFRRIRREILTPLVKRDIAVLRAELDELEAECDRLSGKYKAMVQTKIDVTKDRLKAMQIGIMARIETTRQETEAKIDSLQEQTDRARGERKCKIERHIAELQVEQGRRSDLLKQAQELIKQSLVE